MTRIPPMLSARSPTTAAMRERVARKAPRAARENRAVAATIAGSTTKVASARRAFIASITATMPARSATSPNSVTRPCDSRSLMTATSLIDPRDGDARDVTVVPGELQLLQAGHQALAQVGEQGVADPGDQRALRRREEVRAREAAGQQQGGQRQPPGVAGGDVAVDGDLQQPWARDAERGGGEHREHREDDPSAVGMQEAEEASGDPRVERASFGLTAEGLQHVHRTTGLGGAPITRCLPAPGGRTSRRSAVTWRAGRHGSRAPRCARRRAPGSGPRAGWCPGGGR